MLPCSLPVSVRLRSSASADYSNKEYTEARLFVNVLPLQQMRRYALFWEMRLHRMWRYA